VEGFTEFTTGQTQVAKALGLKDEADQLESERNALASGNISDKDSISRSIEISKSAQEAIDKKIAEGQVMDDEAKSEFSKAIPYYARGTLHSINLVPEVKDWSASAGSAIKSAGLMNAGKLKKTLGTGLFVAKELPGYVKTAKNSYQSLMAFSKANDIDVSDAESLLGDDF
jgi:hypothetical protein